MLSEIGSNFWLSPDDVKGEAKNINPNLFGCDGSDYVWLSTGRSAISYVIKTIEERNPNVNKVVCLPAFTCHTVFEPFVKAGYKVCTLPVDKELRTKYKDILNKIQQEKAGILLIHRYFGFDTLPDFDDIFPTIKELGVVVIEDCTQSMYSDFPKSNADYLVGSIRKWCGVPDGGYAVCRQGKFNNKPIKSDIELQDAKRKACEQKYSYLFEAEGSKDGYLRSFRIAEDILSSRDEFYKVSELTIIVQSNLDVDDLKKRRRNNYLQILSGLSDIKDIIPIFNKLSDLEVPLYFPILCEDREHIQKSLVNNSIYAPVVWPKDVTCPEVPNEADYIYEHILCIPIDQRYDFDDMQRIISCLHDN